MRINVIGTSGSGKSTLSKRIATKLDIPYIEMDRLYWGPNWTEPAPEEYGPRVEKAVAQPDWVLDGNYSRTNHIKWQRADMIVWVDYSPIRTLYQVVTRAISGIISRKELWPGTGNRESLRNLFSRKSIVLWMLQSYRKNRVRYGALKYDPKYQHIRFVHIRSPKEADVFVESLTHHPIYP